MSTKRTRLFKEYVPPFSCSTLTFNLFSARQTYSFLFPFSALITECSQRIFCVHHSHRCIHLIAQVIHQVCSPAWGSTQRFLTSVISCGWKTGKWGIKYILWSMLNHRQRGHNQEQQWCMQLRSLTSMELCQWKSVTWNSLSLLKSKNKKASINKAKHKEHQNERFQKPQKNMGGNFCPP